MYVHFKFVFVVCTFLSSAFVRTKVFISYVRRDSQRVKHVTTGATSVIGWDVGAHGTGRRHSFHSAAAAAAPATLTAQTGAADVTFTDHPDADNRFVIADVNMN